MGSSLRRWRHLAKRAKNPVAIGIAATVIGGGGAIIVALRSGDGADTSVAATSPERAATAGSTSAGPSTTAGSRRDPLLDVDVIVLGAVLHPARTSAGRLRLRARLVVHARAANRGSATVTLGRPALAIGHHLIPADPRADALSTRFAPLAGRTFQEVLLRFETAGEATTLLEDRKLAQLRIAGRSVNVGIRVGDAVRG